MKITNTVESKIYLGLRKEYSETYQDIRELYDFISRYCTKNKIGITVTPTRYFYVNGAEDGVILGLINYPRFPSTYEQIKEISINLGNLLIERFDQYRATIIINSLNNSDTIMLENNNI